MAVTVLLADSSPITKKLILAALQKLSIQRVHDCPDGDTVLEFLDNGIDVHVLFLNDNVTGLDYATVIAKMKERDVMNTITTFLISTQLSDAEYQLLRNNGVQHFITKPFNAAKFESMITPIFRNLNAKGGSSTNEYKDDILNMLKRGTFNVEVLESKNLILAKNADSVLKIPLDEFLRIVSLERVLPS